MVAWIVAVVVAIGLIWSVAAMSILLPVNGSISAAISRPAK
jgi:amino acid transporter